MSVWPRKVRSGAGRSFWGIDGSVFTAAVCRREENGTKNVTVFTIAGLLDLGGGESQPLLSPQRRPSNCFTDQTFTVPSPWAVARRVPSGLKHRSEAVSRFRNGTVNFCCPVT